MTKNNLHIDPASFRDSNGYVFVKENVYYRAISNEFKSVFESLENEGVYHYLIKNEMLLPFRLYESPNFLIEGYFLIKPQIVDFISYPYEWTFEMLRDAALLTLKIQLYLIEKGFFLKDATAYNIQFVKGNPIFIDTLSIDKLPHNRPWIAYKQFIEHFICPMLLYEKYGCDIWSMQASNINGISVTMTSKLLPFTSYFAVNKLIHIHLHAKLSNSHKQNDVEINESNSTFNLNYHTRLVLSLRNFVDNIKTNEITTWSNYYIDSTEEDYQIEKKKYFSNFIAEIQYSKVLDIGGNDGTYCELANRESTTCISADFDMKAVEKVYNNQKTKSNPIHPLLWDISQPSPSIGFANKERRTLFERFQPDLIVCLAFIHHIVISKGISLELVLNYLGVNCKYLIIEFVPKSDKRVKTLLLNREDVFDDYYESSFEKLLKSNFLVLKKHTFKTNQRSLYLLEKI